MDPAPFDGPSRCHQGLGRDLAPEDTLTVLVGAHAPEDVDLDGLDIEELDQEVEGVAHLSILTAPRAGARQGFPEATPAVAGAPTTVGPMVTVRFPEGFV